MWIVFDDSVNWRDRDLRERFRDFPLRVFFFIAEYHLRYVLDRVVDDDAAVPQEVDRRLGEVVQITPEWVQTLAAFDDDDDGDWGVE